ncbi:MAG: TIGR01777 family oxidoreductase [Acidobacteriota bacterium]
MAEFEKQTFMPVPPGELFEWHAREGAFERLVPPWQTVRVLSRSGGIGPGGRVELAVRKGPLWLRWRAEHGEWEEGRFFTDRQVSGPFKRWEHRHECLPGEGGGSLLKDRLAYEVPFGIAGRWLGGGLVSRDVERLFAYRHRRTAADLSRHAAFAGCPRLSVAVTGSSGLVGRALCAFLSTGGHRVLRLVRRPAEAGEVRWDPARGEMDGASLEGLDAVVHLAGENIASGRWNGRRKTAIRDSRVAGTGFLCRSLAALRVKPRSLICASAVGYYGDRGEVELTESSPAGTGFLSEVCRDWEAAAEPAREAGIRVAHARIGVVLSAAGGALPKMLPPFLAGLGGHVGSGRQFMSWISLDDLVGLLHHLLFSGMDGPVHATAPSPVTSRDFARILGKVLRRPAVLPLPGFAVRALFGEMGEALLLSGARVLPKRALEDGFRFQTPDLETALRVELGRE